MAVTTTKTNKPLNPRGNDQSPKGYNRAELYSGKALDFDGANDSVSVADSDDLDGFTNFTYSVIAKADSTPNYCRLFDKGLSALLGAFNLSDQFYLYINSTAINFDYVLKLNEYIHFTIVFTGGQDAKLYVNGVLEETQSHSIASVGTNSTNFAIGANNALTGNVWDGHMSNARLFNTALTAAQVADLYNNPEKIVPTGVADSALKLWLPMQEGAGTTCINGAPDALGSELVTNGTFDTDSDWIKGTGTTISGGKANFTNATAVSLYQNIGTQSGKVQVSFNVSNYSSGTLNVYSGGNQSISIINVEANADGLYNLYVERSSGNANIIFGSNDNFTGSIDDVSVKEVSGYGTINGATWTHGIGAPVAQTSVIDWNKRYFENVDNVLIPQGLTAGRDLLGNLFENVRKQGALNLDGNSRVSVHENASIDISDCSLEAWVCPLPESDSGWTTIFSKVSQANLQIYLNAADVLSHYNSTTPGGVLYGTAFNKNEWHHIVCVEDGADVLTYVDGILRTTKTISLQMDSDGDFSIGSKPGVLADEITAQIAQPRIYNRALTAEEVQRNYDAGKNIYK